MIERDKGCVHITCRCGHQFCFMCCGDWTHDHICKPENLANQPHQGNNTINTANTTGRPQSTPSNNDQRVNLNVNAQTNTNARPEPRQNQ